MNAFWWGCSDTGRRDIRWLSWHRLCMPKRFGGMGFRKLREYNVSMLGKQLWRLVVNPNALVSRVYKARYFPQFGVEEATLAIIHHLSRGV